MAGIHGSHRRVVCGVVGFEAWENLQRTKHARWLEQYKWPIYFFVAVAFWNLVGAGLFGFMIIPIALYYMQGLNTTPARPRGALRVYGSRARPDAVHARAMNPSGVWREGLIASPDDERRTDGDGRAEPAAGRPGATWASVETGYWYAREPGVLQSPVLQPSGGCAPVTCCSRSGS